jgi:DNA-binding MarR family transcriptional regulator
MDGLAGQSTMFSLLKAAEVVEGRLESALADVDLSMAKFSVLTELVAAKEPVALCDLASRLSCVRSNVTQLIDRLEADGLVSRVNDPADRRSVRATLTANGVERHAAGQEAVNRVQAEFATRFDASDRAQLERMLAAIE